MLEISFDNVMSQFSALAGLTTVETQSFAPLVRNSIRRLKANLTRKLSTADEKQNCEYAVATDVFCEYVMAQTAQSGAVLTATGRADTQSYVANRVSTAEALKKGALAQLGSLYSDNSFAFTATNG